MNMRRYAEPDATRTVPRDHEDPEDDMGEGLGEDLVTAASFAPGPTGTAAAGYGLGEILQEFGPEVIKAFMEHDPKRDMSRYDTEPEEDRSPAALAGIKEYLGGLLGGKKAPEVTVKPAATGGLSNA
jgi:hypothetical protein